MCTVIKIQMATPVHVLMAYSTVILLLLSANVQDIYSQTIDNRIGNIKTVRDLLYKCGDSVCICDSSEAKCGGYDNRLRFIPILPAAITKLDFSSNCLPHINASTFRNISDINLEMLVLQNNYVVQIETNSFQPLHYLKILDLSGNQGINVNVVAKAFSNLSRSINSIIMRGMDWTEIPNSMIYYLVSSSLESIDLSYNKISHMEFDMGFFYLKRLLYLNLNYNNLESLNTRKPMTLNNLYISHNRLLKIPYFCAPECQKSCVPLLIKLDLSGNNFKELAEESFNCLTTLKILYLNDNPKILSLSNNFLLPLQSLQELHLSHLAPRKIQNFAFNSSTIEKLYFTNSNLNISIFDNIELVFLNSPQLRILCFSNTKLQLSKHDIASLLSPLTNLKNLNLSNTKLEAIPGVISLMLYLGILDLSSNTISSWNGTEIFGRNSKISSLSLNNNMIFTINETSFPPSVLKTLNNKSFDLGNNPYSCTCKTIKSVNWFHRKANILLGYPFRYQCFSPPDLKGMPLKDYNPSEESCAEKNIALLVSVPVSLISIATLLVIALVYKCRWRLRYGLYVFRSRYKDYARIEDSDNFVYTGFVIYSDDNRSWVHNELIHRIEDQEGFRLCIRFRDFDVGKVHVDNIVDNMLVSEKIIIVLSNNFAKDDWCHFQLLLAETRLLKQNTDMLVLFMLEEISSDCLRTSLYKLVTEGQYALWSHDETGNNLFWKQAISQMKKPSAIN